MKAPFGNNIKKAVMDSEGKIQIDNYIKSGSRSGIIKTSGGDVYKISKCQEAHEEPRLKKEFKGFVHDAADDLLMCAVIAFVFAIFFILSLAKYLINYILGWFL